MQKMFSDSVTTKIIKSDKTTNVLHEQWDKKRGKTCKTLTYQDGAKKDPLIDIEIKEKLPTRKRCSINKIHKTQTKKEKMRKVTRKTVQDKHNPVKKSLKTTSHEKRGKQPFIGLWLDNNFAKNIALMLLKGLPNKKNICWFNSVMTALINIVGAYRALKTPENQSIYFWKTFHGISSYLSIWGDITELPKETHLPMVEEYCNNYSNHFAIGNQEDASDIYIHVAVSIDSNNDAFPSEKLYDIKVKQYLCCLECDKRSETNENDNKCLYLGLNTSKTNGNLTVMDLINNYFEDELSHEYRCSCKSLNSAIARKNVNRPSVISFALK